MIKRSSEMKVQVQENFKGGTKSVNFMHIMNNGEVKHNRMFTKVTLIPGASIGFHEHHKETEYYWILEGEGVVTEKDGDKSVCAGDVIITGDGECHAIRNDGDIDLVFLAIIILD